MDVDLNYQHELMMLYLMLEATQVKKSSKAYPMFSEGPDAINDVQNNITSLLLIFNKSVVFRQQMLFFHSNFDFYLNECTES